MHSAAAKPEVLRIHRMDRETWLHKSFSDLHMWQVCVLLSISVKKNNKERKPRPLTQADQWLHENFSHGFWLQSMFRSMLWWSISNSHILADEFILSRHFLLQSIISESCKYLCVCVFMCRHAHICGVYTYMNTCEGQRSAWWSQILFPTLIT